MKYLRLFEDFNDYDPYELMIIPPGKKAEMIMKEMQGKSPNLNLIHDLISLGADLSWKGDVFGDSLLHKCADWDLPEIAQVLIDAGVDINAQDENGWTALHGCSNYNRPDIAKLLLEAGADPNIQDQNGLAPLHFCVISNHSEMARVVIDAGADVDIQDRDGSTPLHYCAAWKIPKIAKVLIDAGADKTIIDNKGKTPYDYATLLTPELKKLLQP